MLGARAALLEHVCALTVGALGCVESYVLAPTAAGPVTIVASFPHQLPRAPAGGAALDALFAARRARLQLEPVLWEHAAAAEAADVQETVSLALSIGEQVVAVLVAVGVPAADAKTQRTARELAAVASAALENNPPGLSARREVDDVLAMLAHEIRGQLNEIVLVQGLLLAGGRLGTLTADQQTRVRQLGRAAGRVATQLETLTELSRRDRTDLGHESLQLEQIAASVLMDLAPELAAAPHLQLSAQVSPDLPIVRGDPALVRAIVRVLVQTAIRYSAAADGRALLRVAPMPSGVAVEVSGTGLIPRRPKPHAGVGLALYVLSRMVEPIGGTAEMAADGTLRVLLPVHSS